MPNIQVRTFNQFEWSLYKSLRLSALKESPDAFGGTYEVARQHKDEFWQSRLRDLSSRTDCPVLAQVDSEAAGLAWGKINPSDPETAHLFQMWVSPNFRGLGIGKELLHTVIAWGKSQCAKTIELDVTSGNSPARNLYSAVGFIAVGETEPLRPGSNLVSQKMKLEINQSVT